jgi:hypothetical protein
MPWRFIEPNLLGWLIGPLALALVTLSVEAHAQDLEPRAFANTPVGLNFLIGGYAYSKGGVGTDPSVPIEDAQIRLNSAVLAYVRTLDLWGRSGKFDIILPYTWASGSAKLLGQSHTRDVSGLGDPRLRFSMLFYGAPTLSLDEFQDYKPDIIIGGSFEVTPPLGQYDSDKLLNIGTNRWSFKPELGISKTLGPLTLELSTGVRFYTDNNDFLDGKTLQLSPIYSVQGHLIYSFTPGIWLGLDGLYYTGARGPSTAGKEKASKMSAWASPLRCQLTAITRSNSTVPPMCTRRPEPMPTSSGSLGNFAGAEDFR